MMERAGYLTLLVCLILVAGRVVLAAQSSLAVRTDTRTGISANLADPLITGLTVEDSLLAAKVANRRDPFRPWNPLSTSIGTSAAREAPVATPLVPPRVAVVMDTGTSVIIQIEVDGETSPRLPIGGTFRGWTISGVSATTVTVVKNGQAFTVRRP